MLDVETKRQQEIVQIEEGNHQQTISMQMIPDGAQRTNVRIKTAVNGMAVVQKAEIDRIWVLMQRQVMMNEPLKPAPPTPPTK